MNYLLIAGHLGKDPEVRFTANGQKVTSLRVACRSRKGETIWWQATVWGEQFDKMMTYLKKGYPVMAMGEMMPTELFNGKDGEPVIVNQMTVSNLSFSPFGKPKDESNDVLPEKGEGQDLAVKEDEVPF